MTVLHLRPSEAAVARRGFGARDWALLGVVALAWGSSFLFVDVAVDHLHPVMVALCRLGVGAAVLSLVPACRRPVPPTAWPAIVLLAAVWMAGPFTLFAYAGQRIDSSLSGMLNGAAPLFGALVAALAWRRPPERIQTIGLLAGFAGVVLVCAPAITTGAAPSGVVLVLTATILYGVAYNLAAPLEKRYGVLPVVWRTMVAGTVLLTPFGLAQSGASSISWSGTASVLALGCLGTAAAYVGFVSLVGRVGPTRASVSVYFVPVVAIVLGAVAGGDRITLLAVAGTTVVVLGAVLTARSARTGQVRGASGRRWFGR
jgi:drug/metabolite transporter (DMT)-like permease